MIHNFCSPRHRPCPNRISPTLLLSTFFNKDICYIKLNWVPDVYNQALMIMAANVLSTLLAFSLVAWSGFVLKVPLAPFFKYLQIKTSSDANNLNLKENTNCSFVQYDRYKTCERAVELSRLPI